MSWKVPSSDELRAMVDKWQSHDDIRVVIDGSAEKYRKLLVEIHENTKKTLGIEKVKGHEYKYDFKFGMELYERLNISASTASNDKFWIYLSVYAVPDLVFWRWGSGAHDRYYRNPRRIWLKVLWWYIHLSWQGNREETERCLELNTTDTIVQLVERSGTQGYRVELCRVIMKRFNEHCRKTDKEDRLLFRRLMKLNTARLAAVEPALCEGEEDGYVRQLFAAFDSQQ